MFCSYIFTSSSDHKINTTLSILFEFLLIKLSTVSIAILQAKSFGNLKTPVDMQGNAIVLILFCIASSREFL